VTVLGTHPPRVDLTVHAGEPVDFTIPVLDAAGAPVVSLTGWTAAAQIRATPAGPVLHAFTAAINGASARVTATPADTAAWGFTSAQWDLLLTAPDSTPHILCAGWVRVYPTVTRVDAVDPFSAQFAPTF
jgi:hypothetical protein